MFDGKFRTSADAITAPIGRFLGRRGVSADVLTATGLFFALACGWAIAEDYFWWAIALLIVTGIHDLLDGAVAKASKRASQRGSFFDSVVDRVSDAALLAGVAFWIERHHPGELVLLPFGLVTTFFMISYQRSKAESLGIAAKGGLMERAERLVLLGVALSNHIIFIPVLWAMLVLTTMTAFGRFYRVWQVAEAPSAQDSSSDSWPQR
jgi:CDP-diacylglycerol--glycerol-3-phosphate 3-phosphatidyltransferase